MNHEKAGTDNDIPAKILRNCKDSSASNNIVTTGVFLKKLKVADIISIFKMKGHFNKENYILARRFNLTGDMTNLYPFVEGLLK